MTENPQDLVRYIALAIQCLTTLGILGSIVFGWIGYKKYARPFAEPQSPKAEEMNTRDAGKTMLTIATVVLVLSLLGSCLGFGLTLAIPTNAPATAATQPAPDLDTPDQQPPVNTEEYAKLSNGCESIVPLAKDLPTDRFYSANPGVTGSFLATRFTDEIFPTTSLGYKDYNAGIYIQIIYTGCESAQVFVEYGVTYTDRNVPQIDAINNGKYLVENYVFVYPSTQTALYPLAPQMGQDAYVLTVLIRERAQKVLSTKNVGIHWRGQNELPSFDEVERFP